LREFKEPRFWELADLEEDPKGLCELLEVVEPKGFCPPPEAALWCPLPGSLGEEGVEEEEELKGFLESSPPSEDSSKGLLDPTFSLFF